jgi:hypothetical protein
MSREPSQLPFAASAWRDLLGLDDLSGGLRNRRKRCLNLLATNPTLTLSRTTCTTSTAVAPREMPYEAGA